MAQCGKPLYPAYLDLVDVRVLVVGGGAVAARKAAGLLQAQAAVTVVAPQFHRALMRLKCKRVKRGFRSGDLAGCRVVIVATGDAGLNRRIAQAARRRGALVNVAAPPEAGNLQVPAAVRRGPLCIAISTGGASSALARECRKRLERLVSPEWGRLAEMLEQRRERIMKRVAEPAIRRRLLQRLGSLRWAALIRTQGAREAGRRMDALIAKFALGS